jgi:hypothetical protein
VRSSIVDLLVSLQTQTMAHSFPEPFVPIPIDPPMRRRCTLRLACTVPAGLRVGIGQMGSAVDGVLANALEPLSLGADVAVALVPVAELRTVVLSPGRFPMGFHLHPLIRDPRHLVLRLQSLQILHGGKARVGYDDPVAFGGVELASLHYSVSALQRHRREGSPENA